MARIAEYAALFYPVKWNSPIISQWILYKTDNGSAISIIAPVKMEAVMAVWSESKYMMINSLNKYLKK